MKPAKILQISTYPPPRTGWSVRVEFVKKRLDELGNDCRVLNLGARTSSPEYEGVYKPYDYLCKVLKYSAKGYTIHAHINGDTPKGFILTLAAGFANLMFGKRCVLTFHAGVEQIYFPRHRSRMLTPMFQLMFAMPQKIICNSEAVKAKIVEYSVKPDKVSPIPSFTQQYLLHETVTLDPQMERFFVEHAPVIFCYIKLRKGFYLDTLINGLRIMKSKFPKIGLLLVGTTPEDESLEIKIRHMIADFGLQLNLFEVPDMSHDEFRTAMKRSTLYLRTPKTDGVCSSVLEALSYDLPVAAAENGTRPPSVITYTADDPQDMAMKVFEIVDNLDTIRQHIVRPIIQDTLANEVNLLIQAATV